MLSFDEYLPIHIELCLKNKGKARLLLIEKQKFDRPHYLDDFFFARIQLLENNFAEAYLSFGRLMENINCYEAIYRLMFELQFAKELKLSEIVLLMSDLKNSEIIGLGKKKDDLLINPKEMSKGLGLIIGGSKPIQTVKELIKKYAPLKEIVLITGATGTGKELVARALHEESVNIAEPFLAVNCGALTESLLLSELFGYEAGAFTGAHKKRKGIFEAAGKGTVFLDEFGGVSPHLQVSLLRTLESNEIRPIGGTVTRSIHCRIIIATNTDLQQAVKDKKFRDDLFFRIARLEIKLPNLRERLEDLPLLVNYFLARPSIIPNKHKEVSKQLLDALVAYTWPGNIRELKNEIERLKILYPDKEMLELEDFDFSHLQGYEKPGVAVSETTNTKLSLKVNISNDQTIGVDHESIKAILNRGTKAKRRQSFLRELFKEYNQLTRSQIMAIANIGPSTATKQLQELIDEGYIERHMPTSSPRTTYFKIK
jgi:transcriptional regulator with PAS, ATPase and Fis domain